MGSVAKGGALLVSLRDENLQGEAGVLCLWREDGSTRWQTRTDSSIKNSAALNEDGSRAAAVQKRSVRAETAVARP